MRKAAAVAALALYLGLLGYLAWAYPRLPATVPMQWDLQDRPTSYGTREAFVAIPALVCLAPATVFLLASRRAPGLAWAAPGLVAIVLFVMHAATQAILPVKFCPVPVSTAVLAVFACVPPGLLGLWLAVRRRAATAR
jgi:hypothetical protein